MFWQEGIKLYGFLNMQYFMHELHMLFGHIRIHTVSGHVRIHTPAFSMCMLGGYLL